MRLGVLFSGGKDSVYALWKAMETEEVVCLITLLSQNPESYMFHTPNIQFTQLQAQAIGLPLVQITTPGEKEKELVDLKLAINRAKVEHAIQGVVSGSIESVYQATRIQRICHELDLWCYNPLWKKDQIELLEELDENRFEIIITGIFGYPIPTTWLGERIDTSMIQELKHLHERYQINPAGEGGELESLVVDAPFFKDHIILDKWNKVVKEHEGLLTITEAHLEKK